MRDQLKERHACSPFASAIQLPESSLKIHLQQHEIDTHKVINGSAPLQNTGNSLMTTFKRLSELWPVRLEDVKTRRKILMNHYRCSRREKGRCKQKKCIYHRRERRAIEHPCISLICANRNTGTIKLKTGKTDAQKEKAEKLKGWGQAEKGAGDTPLRIIFTRFWLLEPC